MSHVLGPAKRWLREVDTSRFPKEYSGRKMISEQDEDWIVTLLASKLASMANMLDAEATNIPEADLAKRDLQHEAKGVRKAGLYIASGKWKQQ